MAGQVPAYDFDTGESRGLETWQGDFGGSAALIFLEREGSGWVVQPASYIGDSLLEAWGPQAVINHEARGPDDALLWDDPSTVTGRYYGDERLTSDQVAALVNLLTVGTPASGINYLFV